MGPARWIDATYLWYDEVPSGAAADYATPIDYFAALKTPADGHRPAQGPLPLHLRHGGVSCAAQSGNEVGYGLTWPS